MYCIIPLAGPDCYSPDYKIRPLVEINGRPLIEEVISSRCWVQAGELSNEDMIFVLREDPNLPQLKDYLCDTFPGCRWIVLSEMSRGALLSAAAGLSLIHDFQKPIAVDLADLIYSVSFSPTEAFESDKDLVGIIPYFHSDNEKYTKKNVFHVLKKQFNKRINLDKQIVKVR